MLRKISLVLLIASLTILTFSSVYADDIGDTQTDGSVTFSPGDRIVTGVDFSFNDADLGEGTIILDGSTLTINYTNGDYPGTPPAGPTRWEVVDASGSGAGWLVTIAASDITSVAPLDGATRSIPAGNMSILLRTVDVAKHDVQSGGLPSIYDMSAMTPLDTDPQALFEADADVDYEGMGSYYFIPDFEMIVPANTYAGGYNSDITLVIAPQP
jgi:hypothetical protein